MRKIRSWLDHNKIQPVTFKIISAGVGRLKFELDFRSEDEAFLFEQKFNEPPSAGLLTI